MRVVHVFSALFQGGAESQLERIIFSSDKSIEHVVISLKSVDTPLVRRLRLSGVQVFMCNMQGPLSFAGLLKLRRVIKKLSGPIMILQCWMYHANFAGWLATIGFSCPIFWNIRRTLPPSGVTGKLSKICGFISKLSRVKIFCNSFSGIESHVISGYRRDSFIYAPNGFYSNEFSTSLALCEDIGVSKTEINVVCVGRYDPIKGHRFLIEAFALQEDMLPTEIWSRLKLYFVGREIENAKDVQAALNKARLDGKVKFLGERKDIKRILHCFDIFCLPSLSEGFPNVLVEAMLAGLPCVATNVGDTARILRSEEFVSEPGDSAVMAEKLRSLIVAGESFRLNVGENNKGLVLERYTMEKALACYESYYRASISAGSVS